MTDLPNRVSKQKFRFIVLIIVIILENFTLGIFWDSYFPKYPDVCFFCSRNKESWAITVLWFHHFVK